MTDSLTPAEAVRDICTAITAYFTHMISENELVAELDRVGGSVVPESHKRSWEQFDD